MNNDEKHIYSYYFLNLKEIERVILLVFCKLKILSFPLNL